MFVGAAAELGTIGAVLPFLALMADPSLAQKYPHVRSIFSVKGVREEASLLLLATILFGIAAVTASVVRLGLAWVSSKLVFAIGQRSRQRGLSAHAIPTLQISCGTQH